MGAERSGDCVPLAAAVVLHVAGVPTAKQRAGSGVLPGALPERRKRREASGAERSQILVILCV